MNETTKGFATIIAIAAIALVLVFIGANFFKAEQYKCWTLQPVPPYSYIIHNSCTGEVRDGVFPAVKEQYEMFSKIKPKLSPNSI